MRPIDADKLIKELNKKKIVGRFNTIELIKKAPIVEPNLKLFKEWKCQDCEERERSFHDGWQMAKLRFERPQAKWINSYKTSKCSRCYFMTVVDTYNYCPNCGADMRGVNNGNKNG